MLYNKISYTSYGKNFFKAIIYWILITINGFCFAEENQESKLFQPFYPNYVVIGADNLTSELVKDNGDINADLKFQLSFVSQFNTGVSEKVPFGIGKRFVDIFGPTYFGYTQESYWDIGRNSAPFRETNYRPEIFLRLPKFDEFDLYYGWIHESNGRDGDESRGWDRLFVRFNVPFGGQIPIWNFDIRLWYILDDLVSDRNEDIWEYAGNFESIISTPGISNKWLCFGRKKCDYALTVRKGGKFNNFSRGLAQLDYRSPITKTGIQLVAQISSGHGHSIVRHDVHESAIRVLLQFSSFSTPGP